MVNVCPVEDSFPWFAIRVRSKHERVVTEQLASRNYDTYAPTFKSDHQWSDRKKVIEDFLFPGYVFCRFNPEITRPILTVRGVVNVVGFGAGPVSIDNLEIERIRVMAESGLVLTPMPGVAVGQRVAIEKGPLAGVEGILEATKGSTRLVVSIELLQRSVSAEIDRSWVRPVTPPPKAVLIDSKV